MADQQHQQLIEKYSALLAEQKPLIDHHALQIVKKLKDFRFEAYLVGGGVRDLLVRLEPKDFDIATSALPQEVKKKVPHCFIIGRRFKLVHAKRGDALYEIATFRRAATSEEIETTDEDERRLVEENFFGNIEEDSFRRDFTINSLYYDPIDHVIVDHCNGLYDIDLRVLRMIGAPDLRLKEDPIRMLRAVRLSQKLSFSIEPELREQIKNLGTELQKSALPRRREEWIKIFRLPRPELALIELYDLNLMAVIAPQLHEIFSNETQREEFLCYIRQFHRIGFDLSDTTELFSAVLAAYIAIVKTPDKNFEDYFENEKFARFCRDELSVFKAEVGNFMQAMQFVRALQNRNSYLKRGDRRKISMLSHASFFLSLKLGLLTGLLDEEDLFFWISQYESFKA